MSKTSTTSNNLQVTVDLILNYAAVFCFIKNLLGGVISPPVAQSWIELDVGVWQECLWSLMQCHFQFDRVPKQEDTAFFLLSRVRKLLILIICSTRCTSPTK
ncbi:hypothetical protein BDZ45DRAFT_307285 [Acephala macrosclerotiorum]|nr:hypothetical protein BDZ45DRAFT_307285 [Acephala macrosclerotiorum]